MMTRWLKAFEEGGEGEGEGMKEALHTCKELRARVDEGGSGRGVECRRGGGGAGRRATTMATTRVRVV